MTFEEMISLFDEMFPIVEEHTTKYIPSEKDSMIVETENGNRFKFRPTKDGFKLTRIK